MAIRNDIVWQVGERGRVYTSQDLDRWMPHETGIFQSLRSITFSGTNAFISGQAGTILSGPTANSLEVQNLGTADWLEGIAASTNGLVTVGDNGSIYFSANGSDWSRRGTFTNWLRSVAFGEDKFLCVGEDGFIASSPDGQDWERHSAGSSANLNKVVWINDRFWIVGEGGTVLTNSFRMDFSLVDVGVTNTLFTVAGNSNEVVIAGDSVVLHGNLETGVWIPQSDLESPLLAPNWSYYSSLWDGRLFLLGGRAGLMVEGFRTNQTAPLNWYSNIQPTRSWLWAITRTPEFYAAVGANGTIVTSENGLEWNREAVPSVFRGEVLLGIGGNTNRLLATGSRGTALQSMNIFTNVVSTNISGELVTNQISLFGLEWNPVAVPTTNDLQGVAEKDGRFVITGGNGGIFLSDDGLTWEPQNSDVTNFLSGVTAWTGGFVAVGAGGVILTSPSGTTWERRNSGTEDWIYSVRYVGGKLVAVGENGRILTSENGTNWSPQESGTTEWLNDVTFAQGFWHIAASSGTLVTSSNATTWTPAKAITSRSLYGAASDGAQVIVVGMEGMILRRIVPAPATPINFVSYSHVAGNSVFLFGGQADQQFVLEESGLVDGPWYSTAFLELSEPGGVIVYEKANDDAAVKFFRTRLLEPVLRAPGL